MSLPKEIQEIVDKCEAEEYEGTVIALFDGSMDLDGGDDWKETDKFFTELKDSVNHKVMEYEGGGEGEGEYCHSIIRVNGKFFKAEWSYYSYQGCDYEYINDTIKEVTPSEKTITVYS